GFRLRRSDRGSLRRAGPPTLATQEFERHDDLPDPSDPTSAIVPARPQPPVATIASFGSRTTSPESRPPGSRRWVESATDQPDSSPGPTGGRIVAGRSAKLSATNAAS